MSSVGVGGPLAQCPLVCSQATGLCGHAHKHEPVHTGQRGLLRQDGDGADTAPTGRTCLLLSGSRKGAVWRVLCGILRPTGHGTMPGHTGMWLDAWASGRLLVEVSEMPMATEQHGWWRRRGWGVGLSGCGL
jgi:hypothetical protein